MYHEHETKQIRDFYMMGHVWLGLCWAWVAGQDSNQLSDLISTRIILLLCQSISIFLTSFNLIK